MLYALCMTMFPLQWHGRWFGWTSTNSGACVCVFALGCSLQSSVWEARDQSMNQLGTHKCPCWVLTSAANPYFIFLPSSCIWKRQRCLYRERIVPAESWLYFPFQSANFYCHTAVKGVLCHIDSISIDAFVCGGSSEIYILTWTNCRIPV